MDFDATGRVQFDCLYGNLELTMVDGDEGLELNEYLCVRDDEGKILYEGLDDELEELVAHINAATKIYEEVSDKENKTYPETIGQIKDGYVELEHYTQGYIYKNWEAFYNQEGICYIPEYGIGETEPVDGKYPIEDCNTYTYNDIMRICNGNEDMAKEVFLNVDWQSPETYYDEAMAEVNDEHEYSALDDIAKESKEASKNLQGSAPVKTDIAR